MDYDYTLIRQITELSDFKDVNDYLNIGWVLLYMGEYKESDETDFFYILGWPFRGEVVYPEHPQSIFRPPLTCDEESDAE